MIELAARCRSCEQVEQIGPDLRWPELIGRFAEMAGEAGDLLDVDALGVRRQVADLHVLDHATAKRAHRQLLCETNSATWRRRIVSLLSCQPQEMRQFDCNIWNIFF